MSALRRVCVFCGSSTGHNPSYRRLADQLGRSLAKRGLGMVFGGGRVGLMGAVADGALAGGGEVIGVIPQALIDREIGHRGLTELRIVGSMHERKALMAELSEDPGSAKSGQSYDVTPDAGLVEPFKNLSLRLNKDEVGVVKTQFGIHIIQRVE